MRRNGPANGKFFARRPLAACCIIAIGTLFLGPPTCSASVTLPPPDSPANSLTFGDFTVYSMAYLHYQLTGQTNVNAQSPFHKPSDLGSLSMDLVAGHGQNNPNVIGNENDVVDDAYDTSPGTGSPNSPFMVNGERVFNTQTVDDPDPTFAGDTDTSWDAHTSAIRDFLGPGEEFVVWFNFNETGNDTLEGNDLLAWAQAVLVDLDGGEQPLEFYLNGGPTEFGQQAPDDTMPDELDEDGTGFGDDVPDDPRWTRIHGVITVDETTRELVALGPDTDADPNTIEITQNLGQNNAEFAIYNPDLSAEILDPNSPYDVLQVSYKLARMNGGFEDVFIQGTFFGDVAVIPEPFSVAVWAGLLGACAVFGYRRRGAALPSTTRHPDN